jgi:hypothetical protein
VGRRGGNLMQLRTLLREALGALQHLAVDLPARADVDPDGRNPEHEGGGFVNRVVCCGLLPAGGLVVASGAHVSIAPLE